MAVSEISPGDVSMLSRKERSPLGDAFRQLLKNRLAVVSGIFIIVLINMTLFAGFLNTYYLSGYQSELDRTYQQPFAKQVLQDNNALPGARSKGVNMPNLVYPLGADNLGRDLWTRTLYGARVSISVAVVASSVSLVIGVVYGLVAGYVGGRADNLMMRFVDFLYGLPIIIVVILLQVYFKAIARQGNVTGVAALVLALNQAMGGLLFVFIAMGALNWIGMARIARGQTLSYKEMDFVTAAHATGVTHAGTIFRHILPNILGPCIVQETLQIPGYILTEAFLSFIGLGVDAPTPSWGIMIQEAYQGLRSYPHVILPPAAALTVTVLAFNFLGDGLRDAFDPRLRE